MAFIPLLAAGIGAAGSIGGALLSRHGNRVRETKMQKTQRKLVDSLLASLNGNGPYSDLFAADENAFQKSFVNPAKQRFQNQIAPQIQQQYIASGQQRGTGMSDQLLRAGVDLNSLLDEHYMSFLQEAQNRKAGAINGILGMGAGAPRKQTSGEALSQGAAGFLASDSFKDLVKAGTDYASRDTGGGGGGYNAGMDSALQARNSNDLAMRPRRGFQKPLV